MADGGSIIPTGGKYEKPKLTKIGNIDTYGIAWKLHCNNRFIDLCSDCLTGFKKWFEEGE